MTATPNLSELESFNDKEYDEYVVWKNSSSLLSKDTSSASEYVTVYGTLNNTKVSTGCLESPISTESSTNSNSGSNDAAGRVRDITMVRNVCAPFLRKKSSF